MTIADCGIALGFGFHNGVINMCPIGEQRLSVIYMDEVHIELLNLARLATDV